MRIRRRAVTATLFSLLLLGSPLVPASTADTGDRSCADVTVPVALVPGTAANHSVYGRFCEPSARPADTAQLLLHGLTYDHTYWDLPDPAGGDRQSYTAAANRAGMATLAIDRIGIGRSSHPAGLLVTVDTNAFVAHQVVKYLRDRGFARVVEVGHSYGSWVSWIEASDYHSADAYLFTGISHGINATAPTRLLPRLYPAALDPALRAQVSDLTYLTSLPSQRYTMFHEPGRVDPALLAFDEEHKQTVTVGEIDNFPLILLRPLDVRAPTLLINGSKDQLFCGLLAADCSSPNRLLSYELPRLGAHVPSVDAIIVPGAGHSLTYAQNADQWYASAQNWITKTLG